MQKLNFFDCNCSVGRVPYPHLHDIPDAAGLLNEMETAGIEEALVYHTVARYNYPPDGNFMLTEAIRDHPSLHPVWILLPHHTGEMPPPDQLLPEMKKNDVRAARIFPKANFHSFSIADWCSGTLLGALEEAGILLILDMDTVDWDDVHALLRDHRKLPIVAANCTYRNNRYLYPLLEKYDHFYIELSRFMGCGAVEDLVKRFGPHRLLFGTNMPQYTGTAAVALLTYADISPADKQAIAGDNLRNLLKNAWK